MLRRIRFVAVTLGSMLGGTMGSMVADQSHYAWGQLPSNQRVSVFNQLGRAWGWGFSDGYHECPECQPIKAKEESWLSRRPSLASPAPASPALASPTPSSPSRRTDKSGWLDKINLFESALYPQPCADGGCREAPPASPKMIVLPPSADMYQTFAAPCDDSPLGAGENQGLPTEAAANPALGDAASPPPMPEPPGIPPIPADGAAPPPLPMLSSPAPQPADPSPVPSPAPESDLLLDTAITPPRVVPDPPHEEVPPAPRLPKRPEQVPPLGEPVKEEDLDLLSPTTGAPFTQWQRLEPRETGVSPSPSPTLVSHPRPSMTQPNGAWSLPPHQTAVPSIASQPSSTLPSSVFNRYRESR